MQRQAPALVPADAAAAWEGAWSRGAGDTVSNKTVLLTFGRVLETAVGHGEQELGLQEEVAEAGGVDAHVRSPDECARCVRPNNNNNHNSNLHECKRNA